MVLKFNVIFFCMHINISETGSKENTRVNFKAEIIFE